MRIKTWIEANTPHWVLDRYRSLKFDYGFKQGQRTWSQEGEDMILRRIFAGRSGFYVDIGAHHPYRFSNTYCLYRSGWRGINVDALPDAIRLFNRARPSDINVNIGISSSGGVLRYFMFNDPAFNTFDERLARHVEESVDHVRIVRYVEVETIRLADLLDSKVPSGTTVNLMNVDVEGMDMDVLQSNDWIKFRPEVLLVEIQWKSIDEILTTDLYRGLSEFGYGLYAKCINTVIFTDLQRAA